MHKCARRFHGRQQDLSAWNNPANWRLVGRHCSVPAAYIGSTRSRGARRQKQACSSRRLSSMVLTTCRCLQAVSMNNQEVEGAQTTQAEMEELHKLVMLLPPSVRPLLEAHPELPRLVEVVMDLGRPPLARFASGEQRLCEALVTAEDLAEAVGKVGTFDADNRAGINATLHRISCIRNRQGRIIGLTCRVGRAIEGSAAMVEDFVRQGRSLLLLGRPGVGKTTAIREISRMLANECGKRTVIVDTSNEIGGDGDVPHDGIGDARRMQVPRPEAQHQVMIEAVENHMPQVIVIDEIGTEQECLAARTIAQRGVQLVATAHGNELENVIKNPALSDLVGGITTVTLGDELARKRGVQKTVLERAAPPTFDVAVEMLERGRWRVHADVGAAVDLLLSGGMPAGQLRERDAATGRVRGIEYMGTIRKVDERGVSQKVEWWSTDDGQEVLRPPAAQDAQPARHGGPATAAAGGFGSSSISSGGSWDGAGRLPTPRRAAAVSGASDFSAAPTMRRPAPPKLAVPSPEPPEQQPARQQQWPAPAVAAAPRAAAVAAAAPGAAAAAAGASPTSGHLLVAELAAITRAGKPGSGAEQAGSGAMRLFLFMEEGAARRTWATLQELADPGAVALTADIEAAQVVVATRSKLRENPKLNALVRKLGVPIYAVRSTSTPALVRDLGPLLGLNTATLAAGTGADSPGDDTDCGWGATAMSQSSSYDSQSEDDEAASGSKVTRRTRADPLTAADDYANLLDSMVRELRYAPIDREYSSQILASFLEEMSSSRSRADASGSSSCSGCSTRSLATMAWALAHTKHKKKFVAADAASLTQLATACAERWAEFSPQELLRLASGFAGLRFAPSLEWAAALMSHGKAALPHLNTEQVEHLSAALFTLEAVAQAQAAVAGAQPDPTTVMVV